MPKFTPKKDRVRWPWGSKAALKRALRKLHPLAWAAFGAELGRKAADFITTVLRESGAILIGADLIHLLVALNFVAGIVCWHRARKHSGLLLVQYWGAGSVGFYGLYGVGLATGSVLVPEGPLRVGIEVTYVAMSLALLAHLFLNGPALAGLGERILSGLNFGCLAAIPVVGAVSPKHVDLAVSAFGAVTALRVWNSELVQPRSRWIFLVYAGALASRMLVNASGSRAIVAMYLLLMGSKMFVHFSEPRGALPIIAPRRLRSLLADRIAPRQRAQRMVGAA